jgi:hypothetical protein
MLKRFANDFLALAGRVSVLKCNFEIAQGNLPAVPIENRHQRAEAVGDMKTNLARKQRNQFGRDDNPNPLKPVPKPLPLRAHYPL